MSDDIRPRGTVQVLCSVPGCGWEFWIEALHPSLPGGPFYCAEHEPDPVKRARLQAGEKAEHDR
jgi:hypothetical protein